MDGSECPPWKLTDELATKTIWGPSQEPAFYYQKNSEGKSIKISSNQQLMSIFLERIECRWIFLHAEIVEKIGYVLGRRFSGTSTSSPAGSGQPDGPSTSSQPTNGNEPGQESAPTDVDWSTLRIVPLTKDGAAHAVDEDHLYEMLGLRAEDEKAEAEAAERAGNNRMKAATPSIPVMSPELEREINEAAIPVNDDIPDEPLRVWNIDDPDMSVSTVYPDMKEFRMAVKQHAIVEEFELATVKSDKKSFRGKCSVEGCPWRIVARTQADKTVRIQINTGTHKCASTARVVGRMATQEWVAQRVATTLKKKPNIGARKLQEELEDKYKVNIPYPTVWKGKERASNRIFGDWNDCFDWLYSFKAEVEMRCPGSVIEIDTYLHEDEIYFSKFFCAFQPCIQGFHEGCRPYICIDSTHLNGKWNCHLAAANALDGHNWSSRGLGHLSVTKGGEGSSEVIEYHDGEEILRHVVYPERHQCTCREWQVTGKPCKHALAVITSQRLPRMENYVNQYFSVSCFRKAYAGVIPSITDRSQWPEVDKGFTLKPPFHGPRGVGRQKKK